MGVILIFRDCYFEYAGVYSGEFNLILAYVGTSNYDFDTGGKYEPSIDNIPERAESLLYRKDYSESPLEFDVEIVNPDEAIPFEQFIEIKEWLFGQEGWKKLKLIDDDYQKYYLNCLLIPDIDIVDGTGYRGIKCKVRNISAFWYKDDKAIEFTRQEMVDGKDESDAFSFIVNNDSTTPLKVFPIIKFRIEETTISTTNPFYVSIENETNGSKANFKLVGIAQRTLFYNTTHILDMELLFVYSEDETEDPLYLTPATTPLDDKLLYLDKGDNQIKVSCSFNSSSVFLDYLHFDYHPRVRIGGF